MNNVNKAIEKLLEKSKSVKYLSKKRNPNQYLAKYYNLSIDKIVSDQEEEEKKYYDDLITEIFGPKPLPLHMNVVGCILKKLDYLKNIELYANVNNKALQRFFTREMDFPLLKVIEMDFKIKPTDKYTCHGEKIFYLSFFSDYFCPCCLGISDMCKTIENVRIKAIYLRYLENILKKNVLPKSFGNYKNCTCSETNRLVCENCWGLRREEMGKCSTILWNYIKGMVYLLKLNNTNVFKSRSALEKFEKSITSNVITN